jgi:NADH-quinone oxidoreductase subunit N
MTIFMVSLAGVPPTAGFVAKFYLFGAAVEAGLAWLAVIGVLNSVISAYYYLRLIVIMYMREPVLEAAPASTAPLVSVSLAIAATATLLLGLLPSALLALAQSTVGAIFKI